MSGWMVGIDTGGTFTDLIAFRQDTGERRLAKVPSVPSDPSEAVLNALNELIETGIAPGEIDVLVHGTTVATNAILEDKGAKTGLLVTKGFRAIYEARGWSQPTEADLIDPFYRKPQMLVPQYLTEEVGERLDYRGEIVTPLDEGTLRVAIRRLREKGIEAVAVCLLFSFLNPAHERRVGAIIAEEAPEWRVSLSSEVLPVIREYPRLSTTVIDAYVGPKVADYLDRLVDKLRARGLTTPQLFLMQSNGGLMRISIGARHPNQTLLSGPAAGVISATELARSTKNGHLITFDMGGTSADISVIVDGRVLETSEGRLAGQDIGTPMLKVRTLGAGGGTIAWIGKDGLMKVGPHSSGAMPGPACYMRGGTEPTVTDANLVLGALSGSGALAGKLKLNEAAAKAAVEEKLAKPLGLDLIEAAAGVIKIVNTHMAVDLRLSLQEEGQDPRKFALVAFGGAGPLHAAALARTLKIPTVIVPAYPGLTCAMGLLQTEVRHTYLQSAVEMLSRCSLEAMESNFRTLEGRALSEAAEEGFERSAVRLTRQVDLRYLHQGYQLSVDCPDGVFGEATKTELKRRFDALHKQIYGQSAPDEEAEIVTFRMRSEIAVPRLTLGEVEASAGGEAVRKATRKLYDIDLGKFLDAGIYDRDKLGRGARIAGPAVIEQFDATTVVLSGQTLEVDSLGNLIIHCGDAP
ncbi:MAG: hydantoinase/oxoprolinase family protein [Alphaproteobacteria bacterium]